MQGLVEMIMNSLFGIQIRCDFNESDKCESQNWMETEWYYIILLENTERELYCENEKRRGFKCW